jgi:hypothetical protein
MSDITLQQRAAEIKADVVAVAKAYEFFPMAGKPLRTTFDLVSLVEGMAAELDQLKMRVRILEADA